METKNKKILYEGKMVEVEDCTPTWEGILPLLLEMFERSPDAREELNRMARAADSYKKLLKTVIQDEKDTVDSFEVLIKAIKEPELVTPAVLNKINEIENLIKSYKDGIQTD